MTDSYETDIPSAPDAEAAILGTLMTKPDLLDTLTLSPSDFFLTIHKTIFAAINESRAAGESYDFTSIAEKMDADHKAYVRQISTSDDVLFNSGAIDTHVAIVKEKAVRRQLLEHSSTLAKMALNCVDTSEIIATTLGNIAAVSDAMLSVTEDPMNLFSDTKPAVLRDEYLPPVIAGFARDRAEVMGAPMDIIAMTAIATAAAATHDGFKLRPKPGDDWKERACLWFVAIADPSTKKTPAMEVALQPLLDLEDTFSIKNAKAAAEYDEKLRVGKIIQRNRDRKKASGELTGFEEGEDQPAIPPRPRRDRCIIKDATMESLGELLIDNPRGLTLYKDELAIWMGKMDAYSKGAGGADRGLWLETYNGRSASVDRITRGSLFIPNWSMSVIGSTQTEKIVQMVGKGIDDGLWARFMTVTIPLGHRPSQERPFNEQAYREYYDTIQTLHKRSPSDGDGSYVLMSPQANIIREEFKVWVESVSTTPGISSMLRAHLGKWTGLWARLVLTYHCLGCASSKKWPATTPVSELTATRVTNLMKKYLLPHAMTFYNEILGNADPVFALARKVAGTILARGWVRLTNRDLLNFHKVAWATATDWQRDGAIRMLTSAGWLTGPDSRQNRGAGNATAWGVNPRVHVLFADMAKIETARRVAMTEGIKLLKDAMKDDR